MAWFVYSDQPNRKFRKGIWLRKRSLPDDLKKQIFSKMKAKETLAWVEIKELKPNSQVLLEIWCYQTNLLRPSDRYTVFYLLVDENPNWVCESDLGRGLVKRPQPKKSIDSQGGVV